LYAAIFDPRQHRLFGDPIVCHVQRIQSRWRITGWDNCDFGYPSDFETLDDLVTFVDNLALRQAPARLCYLINPWPDVDSPANFHMTGHPRELRLTFAGSVIVGTPSEVTAELVEARSTGWHGHLVSADGDPPRVPRVSSPVRGPALPPYTGLVVMLVSAQAVTISSSSWPLA
jgi:hypothetical protein